MDGGQIRKDLLANPRRGGAEEGFRISAVISANYLAFKHSFLLYKIVLRTSLL